MHEDFQKTYYNINGTLIACKYGVVGINNGKYF